jgi:hypothetical protein
MTTTTNETDTKALALRQEGKTYPTIVRTLGLPTVRAAVEAFNRGLRLQPKSRQPAIRRAEEKRLDALWQKAQHDTELSKAELERRRKGIAWHRSLLAAD